MLLYVTQVLKDPHMFAASTIRRALELKAPFLQCVKYFHTISCVDLLGKHLISLKHGTCLFRLCSYFVLVKDTKGVDITLKITM